jgi:hypothetical protein
LYSSTIKKVIAVIAPITMSVLIKALPKLLAADPPLDSPATTKSGSEVDADEAAAAVNAAVV